ECSNHFGFMSSGGDSIRMCGFSAFLRYGMQYFDTMKVPRVLMPIIRSNRFMSVPCELVRLMALALLTQMWMRPNSATVLSIAAITCASSGMSQTRGNALPPAARTSSAAVKIVPASFGWGSVVLAAIATLAPSRAARSAIASPMPRLAPEMNSVLPLSEVIGTPLRDARNDVLPPPLRGRVGEGGQRKDCVLGPPPLTPPR